MKITYSRALTINGTMIQEEGQADPIPLYIAILQSKGLPVEAAIRFRTVRDRLVDHIKRFTEQRDEIMSRYQCEFDKEGKVVALADAENPQIAECERDLNALLAVEVDGLPPLRASVLSKSTDDAAIMLSDPFVLDWLGPLVIDDLG